MRQRSDLNRRFDWLVVLDAFLCFASDDEIIIPEFIIMCLVPLVIEIDSVLARPWKNFTALLDRAHFFIFGMLKKVSVLSLSRHSCAHRERSD